MAALSVTDTHCQWESHYRDAGRGADGGDDAGGQDGLPRGVGGEEGVDLVVIGYSETRD